MISSDVIRRENNERNAWNAIGTHGRAVTEAESDGVMSKDNIERYRKALTGERSPRTPLEEMFALLGPSLEGKKVLEICCHTCEYGIILASLGAEVISVDISESLIDLAKKRVELNGLSDRITPIAMSVHNMAFEDRTFDIVFCKSGLHHLDVVAARDEIFRVLKPGGIAVLSEPIALSKHVADLRDLVPVPHAVESPDERPLTGEDLYTFSFPFKYRKDVYYRILSRMDRFFQHKQIEIMISELDRLLIKSFPYLRYLAGVDVLLLKK
jgi:ubiquinone/menaquinone biosynthesis C-methylase UbiE